MESLGGILKDAAICLFNCGKIHAAYVYKLEENLESLEGKCNQLRNSRADVLRKIEDMERMGEMRRTDDVNDWLQQVDRLQTVIENIQHQGSLEIQNKCLCNCCPKNCVSSYKLGKKLVKMLNEVDGLVTSGKRFADKNVDIVYKLPPKRVEEMPSVDTIGMDSMFDKVWNSIEDENVTIIGLYAMGGAGKTTLMKIIHNEFGKREHGFDVVLWVVVSREFDINKIMNDIRNRLGVTNDTWDNYSDSQRAAKIYQILKQKKFVLMLDDLWGKLELEKVGVPLLKDTNYQSKVLLTTRYEDVCDKMQAEKKFKVECLLEHEAFNLFCQKVGEQTLKCHREISELAKEMAQECGGLPLALITVGSAMAGVKSVEAWSQAKSDLMNSPSIASDLEEKVFRILKFSYDRLPDETHRRCFLYCALYPEDYEIVIDGLIDRWIGEGFLGKYKTKRSIYDMREEGKSIIAKLKLSSLLEDAVEKVPRICSWDCAIKMHDVIRDMALWLARDEDGKKDKVVVEGEALALAILEMDDVERISIINAKGIWQVPACPNLLSLRVQERHDFKITDYSNLQCMTRLKVLDLSDDNLYLSNLLLPPEIGKLINLEFLCLSRKIIKLPIELKNLKNLRVFLMEYVEVDEGTEKMLSEVIESFERLKVFRFSRSVLPFIDNREDSEEATLIEKLESLRELEELGIGLLTMIGLQKLLNSTKLRDCVRYMYPSRIIDPLEMASLLESLSRMKHLERIHLSIMPGLMEGSSIAYNCHLLNLRWVRIYSCDSITHLTWLKYAPLLEYLVVLRCDLEEVVKGGEDEDRDNSSHIFSNLKRLQLSTLPKLKSIHNRALPFPSLKIIQIDGCPNLRKLPLNSNSAKDTLIAIEGELDWWNNLEWEDPAIKDPLHSKFREIE